jgi:hypothetical protein
VSGCKHRWRSLFLGTMCRLRSPMTNICLKRLREVSNFWLQNWIPPYTELPRM